MALENLIIAVGKDEFDSSARLENLIIAVGKDK